MQCIFEPSRQLRRRPNWLKQNQPHLVVGSAYLWNHVVDHAAGSPAGSPAYPAAADLSRPGMAGQQHLQRLWYQAARNYEKNSGFLRVTEKTVQKIL
jgi:hypothetical protein